MQRYILNISLVVLFLSLFVRTTVADTSPELFTSDEHLGFLALKELGFRADFVDRRGWREAFLLKGYQQSWNDFDPSETNPLKVANPDKIASHFTDGAGMLYRDMCTPTGLTSKEALKTYLRVLYAKYPRQIWGNGWKNIHLYKGASPGEWAYSYDFAMYRSMATEEKPALTGTGMERVRFNENGKLISDEVHLILNSGVANCQFPGQEQR